MESFGPHEIVIQLHAVGLNRFNVEQLETGSAIHQGPTVLEIEGSGVVARRGDLVEGFNVGDEVLALFWISEENRSAAFQSHAVVNTSMACHKPSNMSFVDAASIPLAFETAARAIREALSLPPSWHDDNREASTGARRFMIFGGNSPVGSNAVQILRHLFPDSWIGATIYGDDKEDLEQQAIQMVMAGTTFAIDGSDPDSLPHFEKMGRTPLEVVLSFLHPQEQDEEVLRCLGGPRVFFANEANGVVGPGLEDGSSMELLEKLLKSGQYQVTFPAQVVGRGLDAIEEALREAPQERGSRKGIVVL